MGLETHGPAFPRCNLYDTAWVKYVSWAYEVHEMGNDEGKALVFLFLLNPVLTASWDLRLPSSCLLESIALSKCISIKDFTMRPCGWNHETHHSSGILGIHLCTATKNTWPLLRLPLSIQVLMLIQVGPLVVELTWGAWLKVSLCQKKANFLVIKKGRNVVLVPFRAEDSH